MAIGIDRAVLLETDGGEWDPVSTAGVLTETIEAQEAANGAFDLILFGNEAADTGDFQVGVRVAVALGRPVINGIKEIWFRRWPPSGVRAARGADGRLGDVRAAAARDPRREGGAEPARATRRCRAGFGRRRRRSSGSRSAASPSGALGLGAGEDAAGVGGDVPGPTKLGLRLPAEERTAAEVIGRGRGCGAGRRRPARAHRGPRAMSAERLLDVATL